MTMTRPGIRCDLAVVMPVYNEEACIAGVIASWVAMLDREHLTFRLIALNDGSTDMTRAVLDQRVTDPRVEIVHKLNSGHGPTILEGYRRAADVANWVFQVDSDDEIAAGEFPVLWRARLGHHAVFGIRTGRRESVTRWVLTRVSRMLVHVLYGYGVTDVNVPFRLMRAEVLSSFVSAIPADTFAPNVVIAGILSRRGFKVANVPVTHHGRRTGRVSIVRLKLLVAAVRSAAQTVRCRRLAVEPGGLPEPVVEAADSAAAV